MTDFLLHKVNPVESYILKKHSNMNPLEINILNGLRHPNLLHSNGVIMKGVICSKLEIANYPLDVYCNKNNLNTMSKIVYVRQILEGINYLHNKNIALNNIKLSNIVVMDNNNAVLCDFSKCCYEREYKMRSNDIHDFGIAMLKLIDDNSMDYINNIPDKTLCDSIKNFISRIFVDQSVRSSARELLNHSLFTSCKKIENETKVNKDYALFDNHRNLIKVLFKLYSDIFENNNSLDNSLILFIAVDMLYRLGKFGKYYKDEDRFCATIIYIAGEMCGILDVIKYVKVINHLFEIKDIEFIESYKTDIIIKLNGILFNSDLYENNKSNVMKCISTVLFNSDSNTYIKENQL